MLNVGLRVHLAAEDVARELHHIELPGYLVVGWLALRVRVDVKEDHALDDFVLVGINERVWRHGWGCARTGIAHGQNVEVTGVVVRRRGDEQDVDGRDDLVATRVEQARVAGTAPQLVPDSTPGARHDAVRLIEDEQVEERLPLCYDPVVHPDQAAIDNVDGVAVSVQLCRPSLSREQLGGREYDVVVEDDINDGAFAGLGVVPTAGVLVHVVRCWVPEVRKHEYLWQRGVGRYKTILAKRRRHRVVGLVLSRRTWCAKRLGHRLEEQLVRNDNE